MMLSDLFNKKTTMPTAQSALPGREQEVPTSTHHFVNGNPLKGPFASSLQEIYFGMGCFWGAERLFWKVAGVHVTAVGYAGGITKNPTYPETTTGLTGHAEVVLVVFDPNVVSLEALLKVFFEQHDPTQGNRQGNDVGTTYRSVIYTTDDEQLKLALAARDTYQAALAASGVKAEITTEIAPAPQFYYATEDHQQYLAKNPGGYCGLRGTGVTCSLG